MLGLLIPLLSKIPGLVGTHYKRKQDLELAKHERDMEFSRQEKLIQGQVVAANLKRGTKQLQSTGRFFKYFTFVLWFGPFATAFVAPEYSVALFERLAMLPDWYIQSCMVIIFAIWGIASSRNTIANIFAGLGTFMLHKQANKLNIKLAEGTKLPPSDSNLPSNKDYREPK